jgi:hypothetical protein
MTGGNHRLGQRSRSEPRLGSHGLARPHVGDAVVGGHDRAAAEDAESRSGDRLTPSVRAEQRGEVHLVHVTSLCGYLVAPSTEIAAIEHLGFPERSQL